MINQDLTSILYKHLLEQANPERLGSELKILEKKITWFQAAWRGHYLWKHGLKKHPKFSDLHTVLITLNPKGKMYSLVNKYLPKVEIVTTKGKKKKSKSVVKKKGKKSETKKESLKDKMANKIKAKGEMTEEEAWKVN